MSGERYWNLNYVVLSTYGESHRSLIVGTNSSVSTNLFLQLLAYLHDHVQKVRTHLKDLNKNILSSWNKFFLLSIITHESMEVNGSDDSNWQRDILCMCVNDHAGEAIVVIHGLHPGRLDAKAGHYQR